MARFKRGSLVRISIDRLYSTRVNVWEPRSFVIKTRVDPDTPMLYLAPDICNVDYNRHVDYAFVIVNGMIGRIYSRYLERVA